MPARTIQLAPERRSGLGLVQVCLGILIGGLLMYAFLDRDTPPDASASYPAVVAATNPPQTVVIQAVLSMPTPTATTLPTATIPAGPTMDAHADDCNRVTPIGGQPCRQPPWPTNTPAPMTDCPAAPGDLCLWPRTDETNAQGDTG